MVLLFLICMIVLLPSVFSQEMEESFSVMKKQSKSVKSAILKSAFIPGWGQWYNDQKFKALIVFGGEMALIGGAIVQNQRAVASVSLQEKEFYQYDRSKFIWWLVAAHLLNVLDAYVDASLWDFDTGPDLSEHQYFSNDRCIKFCFYINLNN